LWSFFFKLFTLATTSTFSDRHASEGHRKNGTVGVIVNDKEIFSMIIHDKGNKDKRNKQIYF
jgi:hypothetical protein